MRGESSQFAEERMMTSKKNTANVMVQQQEASSYVDGYKRFYPHSNALVMNNTHKITLFLNDNCIIMEEDVDLANRTLVLTAKA